MGIFLHGMSYFLIKKVNLSNHVEDKINIELEEKISDKTYNADFIVQEVNTNEKALRRRVDIEKFLRAFGTAVVAFLPNILLLVQTFLLMFNFKGK